MITLKFFTHTNSEQEGIYPDKGDISVVRLDADEIRFEDIDLVYEGIFQTCQDLEENEWYECEINRDFGDFGEYWYYADNFIIINKQ